VGSHVPSSPSPSDPPRCDRPKGQISDFSPNSPDHALPFTAIRASERFRGRVALPARSPDPPSRTRERERPATTPCCATGQAHGATSAPRHSRRPRGPDSTKMGVLGSCGSPPCIISSAHRTTLRRSGSEAQDLTEPDRRGLAPPERHCSTRCRR